ncbi:MAG: hypothetical protein AAF705_20560 [Bacteroidota bacterium]
MNKLRLTFYFCLFAFTSFGQIIAIESFETPIVAGTGQGDCACLSVPDQFSDGNNDYYGRQSDGTISANGGLTDYAGEDGTWYLAGEDHDASDCNFPCTATLCTTMESLVVPNPTETRNYEVSFLAGANIANNAYDDEDFLSIEYSTDD